MNLRIRLRLWRRDIEITYSNRSIFHAMNCMYLASLGILLTGFLSCKNEAPVVQEEKKVLHSEKVPVIDFDTLRWTELTSRSNVFIDIRYATSDNFVKEAVYPCGRCFLKPEAARALMKVRDELAGKGYRIKLYDCYRPRPAQQKLWDKVPNPDYVAPPAEGSMHNRGVAVDLTLTDSEGKEINMCTTYDFFGPEAHHDFTLLPKEVLANRLLLKTAMESSGFQAIRTEWWHYSWSGTYPALESWQWPCPE